MRFHNGDYANGSAFVGPYCVQNPELLICRQRFLAHLDARFPVVFLAACAGAFGTFHRSKPYWNDLGHKGSMTAIEALTIDSQRPPRHASLMGKRSPHEA